MVNINNSKIDTSRPVETRPAFDKTKGGEKAPAFVASILAGITQAGDMSVFTGRTTKQNGRTAASKKANDVLRSKVKFSVAKALLSNDAVEDAELRDDAKQVHREMERRVNALQDNEKEAITQDLALVGRTLHSERPTIKEIKTSIDTLNTIKMSVAAMNGPLIAKLRALIEELVDKLSKIHAKEVEKQGEFANKTAKFTKESYDHQANASKERGTLQIASGITGAATAMGAAGVMAVKNSNINKLGNQKDLYAQAAEDLKGAPANVELGGGDLAGAEAVQNPTEDNLTALSKNIGNNATNSEDVRGAIKGIEGEEGTPGAQFETVEARDNAVSRFETASERAGRSYQKAVGNSNTVQQMAMQTSQSVSSVISGSGEVRASAENAKQAESEKNKVLNQQMLSMTGETAQQTKGEQSETARKVEDAARIEKALKEAAIIRA